MDFKSFDGKHLYVHEWLDVEKPVGVVQIVHGMAEHASRYEPFAKYLNDHGYVVFADDHRGHGLTDPKTLGYTGGDMYEGTVRDEGELTEFYRERFPGLRYFILGFSYGSFVTQSYLARYGSRVDGAIIAGSNYKKDAEVYLGSVVAGISNVILGDRAPSKLIERLSFGAYARNFEDGKWISSDPDNNRAYEEDPFCGFTCSGRFYSDFFRGLRNLYTEEYRNALPKDLPLLIISGEKDPVGDMSKGVRRLYDFYRSAGMRDVELRILPGYRHEFLSVKEGSGERFEELLSFIDRAGERDA